MSINRQSIIEQMLSDLKMYDEWIFDLDNTLYDQMEYDLIVFRDLERWLLTLTDDASGLADALMTKKRLWGAAYPKLFDDVFSEMSIDVRYLSDAVEFYRSDRPEFVSHHNVLPYLERSIGRRPLFVVTNGHEDIQKHKVKCLGLDKVAKKIIYCDKSNPDHLKPSPWAWTLLCQEYRFCYPVYVGDSREIDGGFARNAGIDYYHFEYPYEN